MTIAFISDEVGALVRKYGERSPARLAEDMGVIVRYEPMGTDASACKGFFICQSRQRLITVNSDLPETTQRVILAHELGHAALHKNEARMHTFHDFSMYETKAALEYEANLFAAELLLEDGEVAATLREENSFFSAAKRLNVPPELLDFKLRILRSRGEELASPILSRSDFLKDITKNN